MIMLEQPGSKKGKVMSEKQLLQKLPLTDERKCNADSNLSKTLTLISNIMFVTKMLMSDAGWAALCHLAQTDFISCHIIKD